MRVLMTEDSNNPVSNSFLLDDDSRLLPLYSYQLHILWQLISNASYLTFLHFEMQHTVLRRWHIQINAADWHIWHRTAPTHPGELGLCILVAAPWIKRVLARTKPKAWDALARTDNWAVYADWVFLFTSDQWNATPGILVWTLVFFPGRS